MKTFLISSVILVFVILLIIFFQNFLNTYQYGISMLFYSSSQQDAPALAIIVLSGLGFIGGVLTTMLAVTLINSGKDDEAPGGSNW